ncbi:MAG: hypothetical protein J6Y19_07570 [Kiritimatiellae bacterium]|nr:hypothetical protein [Kiritimatiellia bacterium]
MAVSLSEGDEETTGTTGENNFSINRVVFIRCHGCFPFGRGYGNNRGQLVKTTFSINRVVLSVVMVVSLSEGDEETTGDNW